MSLFGELRALQELLAADDAPLWAEVLGTLLAAGAMFRTGVHVWVVILANEFGGTDLDPNLADYDITAASPVPALRGHHLDRVARILTGFGGFAGWLVFKPAGIPHPLLAAWVGAQFVLLGLDPLLWVADSASRATASTTDYTTNIHP